MTSLRARLGYGLLLSLAAMIVAMWLIVDVSIRGLVEDQLASRLAHDGETLLGGIDIGTGGELHIGARRIQGIYNQPYSGHYFLIDVDGKLTRSRSLWDQSLQVPQVEVGETRLSYITGPQQQPLLVWTRGFYKNGRLIQLSVAEDLLTMQAGAQRFQWRLLAWALALVVLVLLVQQYIVMRSLRPVAAATDDVARLERGETDALSEQVPDEVRPLVHAINSLLQRQRLRLARSRDAIGNLAHAIKTPLTMLQQLAGDNLAVRDAAASKQLTGYTRQIRALVDTALHRARLAGDSVGAVHFDTGRDLALLIDTLQRLHRERSLEIRQHLNGVQRLPLEQQDGMELLGNLLDNACKWARRAVELTITQNDEAVIVIEDDGPGIDDGMIESLLRRGARHDEDTPGYGIGLSIVKSLLDETGGRIGFARSAALGGLRVEVRLPQRPA
jgi:signal transduction histidine kinase